MRNIFYLAIIILMAVCVSCHSKKEDKKLTSLEKMKLKGKVKRYVIKFYNFNENDVLYVEYENVLNFNEYGYVLENIMKYNLSKYDDVEGLGTSSTIYKYDKNNNIINMYTSGGGDFIEYIYKYNKDGKLSLVTKKINKDLVGYDKYDEKGNLIEGIFNDDTTIYKYDNYDNKIKEKNKKNLTCYKYDNNNNLLEISGAVHKTYHYNKKNRKVEENIFDYNDKVCDRTIYKYDNNDNLSEELFYKPEQFGEDEDNSVDVRYNIVKKSIYKYDKEGNCTEECYYDADNKQTKQIIFKYEYDKVGNIIKMTIIENGKTTSVIEYQIEYYK